MAVEFEVEETFDEFVQEDATETKSETSNDKEEVAVEEDVDDVQDQEVEEEESTEEVSEEVETQEQEETEEEVEEEEVSFVDELEKDFGFEYENDYDDSWDGLKGAVNETAEKLAQQQINQLMEQYPDAGQYFQYRLSGGDPQKYQEQVLQAPSYDDLNISEDDTQTQEQLVSQRLEQEGYDQASIEEEINDLKSAGLLKKQAERSKKVLSKKQKQKQEQLIEEQKKQQKKQAEQQKQQQQEFINLIQESSDLGGLRVPETEKDDFTRFMFEPTDDGVTQAEEAWNSMGKEDALAIEYLVYLSGGNGLDLSNLVDNLASTKKAKSISDKLRKTKGKRQLNDKSGNTRSSSSQDFDIDDVDFNQMYE